MRTDFILSIKNDLFYWSEISDADAFIRRFGEHSYMGFGWGDRGFYLEILTWSDVTFKIIFKAMCLPSPTVVHVTVFEKLPIHFKYFIKIIKNWEQYVLLWEYRYGLI